MQQTEISESSQVSESELIKRILLGEKDLYKFIVRKYNQRLYRIGMSLLKDDDLVEDVMQVAYIYAYENLSKFAWKASFSTWLTRILINECLLQLKKKGKFLPLNDEQIEIEMQNEKNKEYQTPARKLVNNELKNILNEAIQQLPEIYQSVFVMREIEDMSIAETKECLSISEVNVKVRLNRAKAMLRTLLANYYKKEDILHFHLIRCDKIVSNVMNTI
jgi:RNA polymerase sigma-70 factor (ECF subfamily)